MTSSSIALAVAVTLPVRPPLFEGYTLTSIALPTLGCSLGMLGTAAYLTWVSNKTVSHSGLYLMSMQRDKLPFRVAVFTLATAVTLVLSGVSTSCLASALSGEPASVNIVFLATQQLQCFTSGCGSAAFGFVLLTGSGSFMHFYADGVIVYPWHLVPLHKTSIDASAGLPRGLLVHMAGRKFRCAIDGETSSRVKLLCDAGYTVVLRDGG